MKNWLPIAIILAVFYFLFKNKGAATAALARPASAVTGAGGNNSRVVAASPTKPAKGQDNGLAQLLAALLGKGKGSGAGPKPQNGGGQNRGYLQKNPPPKDTYSDKAVDAQFTDKNPEFGDDGEGQYSDQAVDDFANGADEFASYDANNFGGYSDQAVDDQFNGTYEFPDSGGDTGGGYADLPDYSGGDFSDPGGFGGYDFSGDLGSIGGDIGDLGGDIGGDSWDFG